VHVKTWMLVQPSFDLRMLVGGVVVGDQVNGQVLGRLLLDLSEKRQRLLVPLGNAGDQLALQIVERSKQGQGAVVNVIVLM